MASKRDFLNQLVKDNDLNVDEDIFKRNNMAFITRTGIEKIQFNNDIRVRYEVIAMQPDYAVVKATATKGPDDGITVVVVESFGEATPENTKQNPPYYSAMAEKRALARVVLKTCGAYKHGVYGEDESEDFKQ